MTRILETMVGAVLVPQVRVSGTVASSTAVVPSAAYLQRFPPTGLTVFGYTPRGPVSPAELLADVRAHCATHGAPRPFACSDMEQGSGHQFPEGTRLPPALALAATATEGDLSWIRSAAAITAREARRVGVELVLAPVADVNTRSDNPIISVRSFGDEAPRAGDLARAFVEGLHAGGGAGCVKHFPGHGDTAQDSHIELARVDRDLAGLVEIELAPFGRVIDAGVECAMIGHLDVPALTREPGLATTLSARAITFLRRELRFAGVILSDAMLMGALDREPMRHARALAAGCDGLLCPADPEAAADEILAAVASGALPRARLEEAAERMHSLRARLEAPAASALDVAELHPAARPGAQLADAQEFAVQAAGRALVASQSPWPWPLDRACELTRSFPEDLSEETRRSIAGLASDGGGAGGAGVALPVVCELAAWKGGYGLGPGMLGELEARVVALQGQGRTPGLIWFGSPQSLPRSWWSRAQPPVLLAFAATPPMVAAVGRWLEGRIEAGGSLPASLG